MDLFCDNKTKQILFNILFIWAKENKDISYQQGMNEILAILFYAIIPFYFKNRYSLSIDELLSYSNNNESITEHAEELYLFIYDRSELESDLYTLFDCLMTKGGRDLFDPNPLSNTNVSSIFRCLNRDNDEIVEEETKITNRCVYVMNVKIRQVDNELFYHFQKININGLVFLQYK